MNASRRYRRRPLALLAVPTVLQLAAALPAGGAAPPAAAVPQSALQSCAAIAADAERLACYDRLAGRSVVAATPAAPASAMPAPARAAGTASLPGAPAPRSPAAAAPAAPAPAVTAPPAPAPAAAAPAPLPKESFGLYAAEHPQQAPSVAPSLEAVVIAIGRSASGRMTVSLEGGAVWELEEPDPLLAVGQTVTITRAALGSFLLHTPTKRTHRARRLH